jgi:alpha-galactosidase
VRYQLDKKAALFKGAVGIDDSATAVFGTAVFEVYGDGKRLWQSGQFSKPKQASDEFSIDVSGVSELELRVVGTGTNTGVHAVWIEPRLLQTKDTPDK